MMPFGPLLHADGTATFSLWAPACTAAGLVIDDQTPAKMKPLPGGLFQIRVPAEPGQRYGFQPESGCPRPDPCSRFQPEGVQGLSLLTDPRDHAWRDAEWPGLPKAHLILYELHVGTFTEDGTYSAAMERLDELAELGINAIELMPLAQAGGGWNWGYDGVNLFAPNHCYGTPSELKALIDAAHVRGLAVILDVVYNHLGPEGNYLHGFGGYISHRHKTPWGDAPNFDGEHSPIARAWILENVRYWIEDFHFDGLRLDATHGIIDHSPTHIVREIGALTQRLQGQLGREIHLIAESNVYDAALLAPHTHGGHSIDALWCDDFLNSVFAQLVPGEHRTHRQYQPHYDLATTLPRGYVFTSTFQAEPQRAADGDPAPLDALISSIQHHDFIGNHPDGLRLHQLTSSDAHRAAAALLLLFPTIPMLFMGEEFASENPFYFFVDFEEADLRKAVEQGRRAEHPQHDWTNAVSPTSPEAFTRSKIGPQEAGCPLTRAWYQDLIRLRNQWRERGLLDQQFLTAHWHPQHHLAQLAYDTGEDSAFVLVRLHPPSMAADPIIASLEGKLQLSQHTQAIADSSLQLGANAVAIGCGRLLCPIPPC